MSDSDQPTTAQLLGAFRKDLLKEGIPFEVADRLVARMFDDMVENDAVAVRYV